MLSILVAQLLPLLLALLGAILGVAIGLLMGPQTTAETWWMIVGLLSALAIAGAAYLICEGRRIEARVKTLAEIVRGLIDRASTIEYAMREAGDAAAAAGKRLNLSHFVEKIENWRNEVDEFLRYELPKSGADLRFRTGNGEIGSGPEVYEYTRLTVLRSNLMSVLDNLPSYVQRSR